MYTKLFTLAALVTAVLATAVTAAPGSASEGDVTGSCNVHNQQCCNHVQKADSSSLQAVKHLVRGLPDVDEHIGTLLGFNCIPISFMSRSGNSCTAQPVCCSNNSFNGVIAIGCTPININA